MGLIAFLKMQNLTDLWIPGKSFFYRFNDRGKFANYVSKLLPFEEFP